MKVYVIGGVHGDEPFGLKVIGKLQRFNDPRLTLRAGNFEAIAKRKRYIESDLNRSFSKRGQCLEIRLARSIKRSILSKRPQYLIDIHTSVSDVRNVAIVAELNPVTIHLSEALGMESIVVMPRHLTRHSLIGILPSNSISVELGRFQRSDKLADILSKRIHSLTFSGQQVENTTPIFEVFATIDKGFKGLENIKNLQFNKTLNGYPFLAGLNTYKSMGGFLAKRIN